MGARAATETMSTGPRGIGGWLILPIIGLGMTILVTGYNLVQGMLEMGGDTLPVLWQQFPGVLAAIGVSTVVGLALIVVAVRCLKLIFDWDPRTPNAMVTFYIVLVVATVIEAVLLTYMGSVFGDPTLDDSNLQDIGRAAVGAAIWIPYFRRSKRVANTFGGGAT